MTDNFDGFFGEDNNNKKDSNNGFSNDEITGFSGGENSNNFQQPRPRKKVNKKLVAITIGSSVTIALAVGGTLGYQKLSTPVAPSLDGSKYDAYVKYLSETSNDLYKDKEIQLFNNNEKRINLYQDVLLANLTIKNEDKTYKSKIGNHTIKAPDPMNDQSEVDIEYIDYKELLKDLNDYYSDDILEKFKASGIKEDDYDFQNKMIDFFSEYLVNLQLEIKGQEVKTENSESKDDDNSNSEEESDNSEDKQVDVIENFKTKALKENLNNPLTVNKKFPTKESSVEMGFQKTKGKYELIDDSKLNELLYSSDEFHSLLDGFSRIALGKNKYEVSEEWQNWLDTSFKANEDLANMTASKKDLEKELKELSDKISKEKEEQSEGEDNTSSSSEKTSSSDDSDSEKSDSKSSENSTSYRMDARDSYISVINKGLEDSLKSEPVKMVKTKTLNEEEKKTYDELKKDNKDLGDLANRSIPYKSASAIPYNWIGTSYLLNTKDENGKPLLTSVPLGDGTRENPASFNTPVITTAVDRDGKQNPVRVTLKEVLTGQEAIDYAVNKDDRNKGLDVNSEIKFAIALFDVENLEDKKIKVFTELTLTDPNRTNISRTGKVYGLDEELEIEPHKTVQMEDWVLATELDNRYAIWGKSFDRETQPMWLRIFKGKDGKIEQTILEDEDSSTTSSETSTSDETKDSQ